MLEAAKHCESMATELLALASALEGAARLLTAQDRRQMPLLDILVEQEQKEVISHPAVQRYLQVSSKEIKGIFQQIKFFEFSRKFG